MRGVAERSAAKEAGRDTGRAPRARLLPAGAAPHPLFRPLDGNVLDGANARVAVGHRMGHLAEQRELASVLQAPPDLSPSALTDVHALQRTDRAELSLRRNRFFHTRSS